MTNEERREKLGISRTGLVRMTLTSAMLRLLRKSGNLLVKSRPEIAKEFNKCMMIAKDAQKHGRVWTTYNPLKTLISRKDISILEEFTMYEILCDLLGLGRDK